MSARSPSPPRFGKRSVASLSLFLFLLSFRIANALTIRTFFQPDEYYQSLEPAWQMIFGDGWLTWEWRNQLRSIAHPLLFAAVYKLSDFFCGILGLGIVTRLEVLVVAPKILQAGFAAVGDYYTAKLAGRLFGGRVGWIGLWMSIGSAFHWFCATRTFSNSLETSVTIIALSYWPWPSGAGAGAGQMAKTVKEGRKVKAPEVFIHRNHLRLSLLLAAFGCILRPTNVLIWMCLAGFLLYQCNARSRVLLVVEAAIVGISVILLNAVIDHWYYGMWTFPPLKFLEFNLVRSLSVFYGSNPWHYYISQGLPLLLISFLPLGLYSLYNFLVAKSSYIGAGPGHQLSVTVLVVTGIYSLVSHKEVRFIYPLLPILHILSAATLESLPFSKKTQQRLLIAMIALNVPIALYATLIHQKGVVDVTNWLRGSTPEDLTATVGFLMPCHSTPWRSSIMGNAEIWALTCEPPLSPTITPEERKAYLDEADRFYKSPVEFLKKHFPATLDTTTILRHPAVETTVGAGGDGGDGEVNYAWPRKLVFFEALEGTLKRFFEEEMEEESRRYRECKRFFNSQVHDDWRRVGDVIVYCLED